MTASALPRVAGMALVCGALGFVVLGCAPSLQAAARQRAADFFGCDSGQLTVVKDEDIPDEPLTKYFRVSGCGQTAVYQCSQVQATYRWDPGAQVYYKVADARVSCTRMGSGEIDRQPR